MSYHHFSTDERKKIAKMCRCHTTVRDIARVMGRNPSSISREIRRNSETGKYQWTVAMEKYHRRREMCCRKPKYAHPALAAYVAEKLTLAWSPEQIEGRLPLDFPIDARMRASMGSIYRWIYGNHLSRSVELRMKLRRYGDLHGDKRGHRIGARELKERYRDAMRRKRCGDWEADTVVFGVGADRGHLLNLTDRKSRYCCLMLLRNVKREEVLRAYTFCLENKPLHTVTSDRGSEFNCHHEFEEQFTARGALYYYTRPASPWQKPTVENTNGLLRQFFPRGTGFKELTTDAVAAVQFLLNNRPRKSLGFKTPHEVLHLT